MKTWKLVSAIISIIIGGEILREGSLLHSFAKTFKGDTTYVSLGIMAGVLILASGIVTLVARSTEKNIYNKIALACYILGFALCFMGPKVWSNLLFYSAWALICAIIAGIDLNKRNKNIEDDEEDETVYTNKYCRSCGSPLNIGAKFCPKCGSAQ